MTPEEAEAAMHQSGVIGQAAAAASQSAAAQYYIQEQEKNLAETQLEVDTILAEVYHLLKQDVYTDVGEGKFEWKSIKDSKERVLTDYGVERLMQVMKSYINKNTLLSNFDDKMINRRMLQFLTTMNGLMMMKYEFFFREPTLDECKQILKERLQEMKKLKMFAVEIGGLQHNEKEIEDNILAQMEGRIEEELAKIRSEKRRENLREYEIMLLQLEQMVESTHNRAFRGEERGSIRRHQNIHQLIGGASVNPEKQGGMLKWFKR